MTIPKFLRAVLAMAALAAGWPTAAAAAPIQITVTIENLAAANSIAFAPLRLGFNNGTFDAFNINQAATAAIISVAEGGSGSDWFPAFAAADPTAVLGSVGGALLPGATASQSFVVDPAINRFFTFASMVIPSNDLFIGNDSPNGLQLLDSAGNLLITSILQRGADIWDAGSEVADPLNAAFIMGGVNANRTPQNGLVTFSFSELNVFNGLTTGAGYVFNSQLANNTDIYRISFSTAAVPEPGVVALLVVGMAALATVRRRRQ